jgi:hypothetical protein
MRNSRSCGRSGTTGGVTRQNWVADCNDTAQAYDRSKETIGERRPRMPSFTYHIHRG